MGDDVEGIVVGHQRAQVQTRHVLNTIFGAYARGQFFVGSHFVAQGLNLFQEFWMALAEGLFALLRTRVEHGTISQDDTCRHHHAVAVGMHTAVHTRGIVDDDAAHHRTSYRGWVRRKNAAIGLQYLIDFGTYDSWL